MTDADVYAASGESSTSAVRIPRKRRWLLRSNERSKPARPAPCDLSVSPLCRSIPDHSLTAFLPQRHYRKHVVLEPLHFRLSTSRHSHPHFGRQPSERLFALAGTSPLPSPQYRPDELPQANENAVLHFIPPNWPDIGVVDVLPPLLSYQGEVWATRIASKLGFGLSVAH